MRNHSPTSQQLLAEAQAVLRTGRCTAALRKVVASQTLNASLMDASDLALRNATYHLFVELGRAPTAQDVADATTRGADDVIAGWKRLHDQHALVLNPSTNEVRMANPFSAVPTAYCVSCAGRRWYANCAWDAFGICATLHADGDIETSCPDCLEPLRIKVRDKRPDRVDLLFHCLVPAVDWWNDIVFT